MEIGGADAAPHTQLGKFMESVKTSHADLTFDIFFGIVMIGSIGLKILISRRYREDLRDVLLFRDMFQANFFFNHIRFHLLWGACGILIPIIFSSIA
jgi:hypothetical protein